MKWFLISIFFLPVSAVAQLKLAGIFSDNMVIQRDQPVHLWGKNRPGNKVVVSFSAETKSTITKADSSWSVFLERKGANAKPQTIIVRSAGEKIVLNNILIGDIWVCSGQSNMEWPVYKEMHWDEERMQATQPLLRFINPEPVGRSVFETAYTDSLNRRLTRDSFYLWNVWRNCDSGSIKKMSAVAYYFAKAIIAKEIIPIGLINLSIGGAPIETFISRESLKKDKRFAAKVKGDWLTNSNLPVWTRERGKQNVGNNVNGYRDTSGWNHAYKPGFAYEAGVVPLLPFPVKGVIWYQGESNAGEPERVHEYADLQKLLVDDYRKKWMQPKMPFYWVQLSSIERPLWPEFRNEQRKLLGELPYSGMAVCSDIGERNNVHPTNKKAVGERLSRWALHQVYNRNIVPSGPLPVKASYKNGKVAISFNYGNGLQTSDGSMLRGFSVDGTNDWDAIIQQDEVILAVSEKPQFIYYGWKPFTDANLVNGERLPASTFKIGVQ
jgi:sialate O-acetylesterase